MQQSDIQKYCNLMEEVKRRMLVINAFGNRLTTTPFGATNIESVYLQLRKILELIALGSLVTNKVEFSKAYSEFSKYWNAQYLLQDLERVNSEFYPQPIIEKPGTKPEVAADWEPKTSGFLTKEDFLKLYEKCGKIMHAGNPYGTQIDYSYFEKSIQDWLNKITGLLSSHYIKLVNDPNIYLVHMRENERSGSVGHYIFAPINRPDLMPE
jgi:hypothetical protein